jgi:hypothetical protein
VIPPLLRFLAPAAAGCVGTAFLGAAGVYDTPAASPLELTIWGSGASSVAVIATLVLHRIDPD